MEIKYTVTFHKNLTWKFWLRYYRLLFTSLWIFAGIIAVTFKIMPEYNNNFGWFLVGELSIIVFIFGYLYWSCVKAIFEKNENSKGDEPREFALTDGGILAKTPLIESQIKWDYISELDEIKDYLFLKVPGTMIPVPKTILTPESTAWIKEKVSKKEKTSGED